jgi:putative FmdB family regulatory protein
MPSYEFRCRECSQEFTVKISWRDKKAVRCPDCQSADLQELIGNYSININGGSASKTDIPAACRNCEAAGSACAFKR